MIESAPAGHNWGGTYAYRARRVLSPRSVAEVQQAVSEATRIRPIGTRHSFNDLADTDGDLLSLDAVPAAVEIDREERIAWVGAAMRYSDVAVALDAQGWALHDLASLPHISVGGAIATGTHGSGSQSLAAAVAGLELVSADGAVRRILPGSAEFAGSVVGIGALGVLLRVALRIEPSYRVAQVAFDGIRFADVIDDVEGVFTAGDSVSLFTDWRGDEFRQVWVKSRTGCALPEQLLGGREVTEDRHPVRGWPADACTEQRRVPGPWYERLSHFRTGFTPSSGHEIQSEYLVPVEAAPEAIARMRELGDALSGVLQVAEMRLVRADELWLSVASGHDVVGLHFTWNPDPGAVGRLVPLLEERLRPLGARPHWGKVHAFGAAEIRAVFPRAVDFAELATQADPRGTFRNAAIDRWFGRAG